MKKKFVVLLLLVFATTSWGSVFGDGWCADFGHDWVWSQCERSLPCPTYPVYDCPCSYPPVGHRTTGTAPTPATWSRRPALCC